MRTSFCSADCNNCVCNKVCNECGAAKASQNPFAEKNSFSPFGVDVSKSPLGSNSNTGTATSTAQPNPNPNQGGLGFCSTQPNKFSSVVSDCGGFGPSNVFATNSWTHSSVFGPSKTTTPFDCSATPINSFKFPPASNNTTASGMPAPAPAPTVDQFSKLTIFAQPQPQPQLTLPIFVLTMMGSSVGLTQIGTLPATPLTNGNGITISGSPTFGSPIISGSPTFGSPATIASFGTGPPSSGSSPTLLFGAPATTALSFPQNAAYGDN